MSRHSDAVDLIRDSHPYKPTLLNDPGLSLKAQFKRLGDLEEAVSRYRDAVGVAPDGSLDKFRYLNNLGNAFSTRFECLEELSDLEEAVSGHRDALDLTPDGHPDKFVLSNSLGNSIRARFEWLGDFSDLERTIS